MSSDDSCLFVENIFRLVLTWCDGGVCPSVRERSVVVRHVPDSPATGDPPVFVWRLGHGQDRQTWTRGARTTVPRGTAQPRTAGVRVSPCLSVHLLINSRNKKKNPSKTDSLTPMVLSPADVNPVTTTTSTTTTTQSTTSTTVPTTMETTTTTTEQTTTHAHSTITTPSQNGTKSAFIESPVYYMFEA